MIDRVGAQLAWGKNTANLILVFSDGAFSGKIIFLYRVLNNDVY